MIPTWVKYSYTTILCMNHMAFAMSFTAIGSILTEMVDILQTTTDKMTLFTTFTSIGFLFGSFFCFLLKYLNRQLVWVFFLVLMSVTLTLVPHSPNLGSLYGCAIGIGTGCGVLNTIINVWIIEMWKEKSPTVLQIPGLTFGIGAILAPLIIKPYLSPKNSVNLPNCSQASLNTSVNSLATTAIVHEYNDMKCEEERRQLLFTPFYILGSIQLLFPILMAVMFLIKRYNYSNNSSDDNQKPMDKVLKLFDIERRYRRLMIILFSIVLATFNIYESMYYTFAPTYFQYSPLKLTEKEAATMITAFTTPYTVFRGISCLVAIKVPPKYMLSAHYLICTVGTVCLLFAQNNLAVLWTANIIIGTGVSAIMQTSFAFVGQHILMSDKIGTILIVVFGLFNIGPPYLLGLFIKDNSIVFIIVEAIALSICIVIFIILILFIRKSESNKKLQS